jgi:hypothetical protein
MQYAGVGDEEMSQDHRTRTSELLRAKEMEDRLCQLFELKSTVNHGKAQ